MTTCKLVVLGDSSVGKTAIIRRFAEHDFRTDYKSTIGADFFPVTVKINEDEELAMQVWDTAGEERFHSIGASFFHGTDSAIIVFDLSSPTSFEHIEVWLKDIREKTDYEESHFPVLLIGNKSDLEHNVSASHAQEFANSTGMKYYEVSAKTGENVENVFKLLATDYIQHTQALHQINRDDFRINPKSPKSGCC